VETLLLGRTSFAMAVRRLERPNLTGFFKMILARSPGFKGIVVQFCILEILYFR
jgi:hypothetical protein